jgi:hypothetical protein
MVHRLSHRIAPFHCRSFLKIESVISFVSEFPEKSQTPNQFAQIFFARSFSGDRIAIYRDP